MKRYCKKDNLKQTWLYDTVLRKDGTRKRNQFKMYCVLSILNKISNVERYLPLKEGLSIW